MSWWRERMCAFDLETTCPLPEEARVVTAAIALVSGGERTETQDWRANPGVPIDEGATAVHGVTNEMAAGYPPAAAVLAELLDTLELALSRGMPLVIFNARFDLTVMDREARRNGLVPLTERGGELIVIDPFVIDKQLHRYRSGKRTLESQAARYGARLDGAHDAAFDAIAAARVAYAIGARGRVIRKVRNFQEERELEELAAEWAEVRCDLRALHAAQQRWATTERVRFAEYKRSVGDFEVADRVELEKGWPVLEQMPHELEEVA